MIPLGISVEYDALPTDGEDLKLRCQDCDRVFVDRERRVGAGSTVLAIFCADCRSARRMRLASPLPVARLLR